MFGSTLSLNLSLALLELERASSDTGPDVPDVVDDSLKVRRGVIGAGDERVRLLAVVGGLVDGLDADKLVDNVAEELETGEELALGDRSLDNS